MTMQYNTCITCGASNGRAGTLFDDECANCYKTRKTGKLVIHLNLRRTDEELKKTANILNEIKENTGFTRVIPPSKHLYA